MDFKIVKNLENKGNIEYTDFLNYLYYTLLLDVKEKDLIVDLSNPNWPEYVLNLVNKFIVGFFNVHNINNFFGNSNNTYDFFALPFNLWERAFQDHLVTSALYTLEACMLDGKYTNTYQMANHTKGGGYFKLLCSKKTLCDHYTDRSNEGNLLFSRIRTLGTSFGKNSEEQITLIGKSSDSKRGIVALYEDIVWRLSYCQAQSDSGKCTNLFIGLHKLLKQGISGFGCDGVKINTFDKAISLIDKAQNQLYSFDLSHADTFKKADYIMYLYKLERFYNLSATRVLFEEIYNHNQTYKDSQDTIDGIAILDTLMNTLRLPNVFSKDIFIKYIFASYGNNFSSNFFETDFGNDNAVITRVDSTFRNVNRRLKWEELTEKFCRYFNNIVFPLGEQLFMSVLIASRGHDSESGKSIEAITEKMIKDMGTYIGDKFNDILGCHFDENTVFKTKFNENLQNHEETDRNQHTYSIGLNNIEMISNEKADIKMYNQIFSTLITKQSNIVHLSSDYKKSIGRAYIKFTNDAGDKARKRLINFYIEEALNRK